MHSSMEHATNGNDYQECDRRYEINYKDRSDSSCQTTSWSGELFDRSTWEGTLLKKIQILDLVHTNYLRRDANIQNNLYDNPIQNFIYFKTIVRSYIPFIEKSKQKQVMFSVIERENKAVRLYMSIYVSTFSLLVAQGARHGDPRTHDR